MKGIKWGGPKPPSYQDTGWNGKIKRAVLRFVDKQAIRPENHEVMLAEVRRYVKGTNLLVTAYKSPVGGQYEAKFSMNGALMIDVEDNVLQEIPQVVKEALAKLKGEA